MNKYNIRKNGKFVKLRKGSLYSVNGVVSRYKGKTEEGKHRFTAHKIFEALVSLPSVAISTIEKASVDGYLNSR